jgi:hypothetical protein
VCGWGGRCVCSSSSPSSFPLTDTRLPTAEQDSQRKRIAALALPSLLNRCAAAIKTYVADAPLRGKMPFPRFVFFLLCCLLSSLSLICSSLIGSDKKNSSTSSSNSSTSASSKQRSGRASNPTLPPPFPPPSPSTRPSLSLHSSGPPSFAPLSPISTNFNLSSSTSSPSRTFHQPSPPPTPPQDTSSHSVMMASNTSRDYQLDLRLGRLGGIDTRRTRRLRSSSWCWRR